LLVTVGSAASKFKPELNQFAMNFRASATVVQTCPAQLRAGGLL